MIGTIDIRVNAAHPNLALAEVCGFVGSPSSVRIANVPERIGTWSLTSVRLVVSYPDNVETERSCVRVNGVWTGTIPAPERAGSVVGGFKVLADGTDENGEPVTGYVLGVGDVRVLNRDNTEGDTSHLFHLKDETPDDPKKADVVHLSGDWKIYDGEGWIPFGAQPVTDYNELENKPKINGVTLSGDMTDSSLGLASKATADELSATLADKADRSEIPDRTSQLTNDSGFLTSHQDVSGKANKAASSVAGNFASLTAGGDLADSGKKPADFLKYVKASSGEYNAVTLGSRRGTVGANTLVNGLNCSATGVNAHAEGYSTEASGQRSHSEGFSTCSIGFQSHAEGSTTSSRGSSSHAEGYYCTSEGECSHAEGNHTTTKGTYSHAEGNYCTTSADCSHAEGNYSVADGAYSLACGNRARTGDGTTGHSYAFAWQGVNTGTEYHSHGNGTFNVNPEGGLSGFWIGDANIADHVATVISGSHVATSMLNNANGVGLVDLKDIVSEALPGGIGWTQSAKTDGNWRSAAYGDGRFIAGSTRLGLWYSDDGVNWTQSAKTDGDWRGIAYGNGRFVAMSFETGIWYSDDGINWTRTGAQEKYWNSLVYGNGRFVAGCYDSIWYSNNGINWTKSGTSSNGFTNLAYGNGRFVGSCYDRTAHHLGIWYSDDGINWSQISGTDGDWGPFAYGNGRFIGAGDSGNTRLGLWYSDDGINWTQSAKTDGWLRSAAYGNGRFVVGFINGIWYSDDGINWTQSTKTDDRFPAAAAYGNGRFVIGSDTTGLWYSDDIAVKSVPVVQQVKVNGEIVAADSDNVVGLSIPPASMSIDPAALQWLKDIGAISPSATGNVCIETLVASLLGALVWLNANKSNSTVTQT